jgi:RNA polymerase sigma-70 factor (ECF subfamily)
MTARNVATFRSLETEQESDAELLQRYVTARDTAALEALFRRHAPAAYRFACRFLDDPADAEDAVQTAFVDVIRLASQFRGESSVKTWILGNVVSACRHKAREEARREAREMRAAALTVGTASEIDAETKEAARRAVDGLPEHYRLPIWLHFFEGLSAAEVALALQTTENTVRSQVRRGLDVLRSVLAANGCVLPLSAIPGVVAALPAETIPATLLTSLSTLAQSGGIAAAAGGKAAGSAALKSGITAKVAIGVVSVVTLAAGGNMLLPRDKAVVPAPVETRADGDKPAAKPAGGAQLGSTDFQPTLEHIVGFRGDWSGRYPGATPPTTWERRAKTAIRDYRGQGSKPKSTDAGKEAKALPFGAITDWLVLGPFPYEDAAKAFDEEFFSGEADAAPSEGEKAGGHEWKRFEYDCKNQHTGHPGAEFGLIYGEVVKQAAYASTNIYVPDAGKVSFSLSVGMGMKVWLNGKSIYSDPKAPYANNKSLDIDLARGWNRLMFKVMGGTSMYDKHVTPAWRVAATLHSKEPSISYETRNIQWMTPMPSGTTSIPLIAGDKIITTSNYSDLLCVSKSTGKILWLRSNYRYDIMSDAEKSAHPAKDKIEPEAAKLKTLNDAVVGELNALISTDGLSTDKYRALQQRLGEKEKLERKICDLTVAGTIKRSPCVQHCGTSNGTPCCDGSHIYAVFGGGIYSGPMTAVCYDLEGKRIWGYGIDDADADEHGVHSSPLLISGKLIVSTAKLVIALDAKTGVESWRVKPGGVGKSSGASPLALSVGGVDVFMTSSGDILRPSDAKRLWNPEQTLFGCPFLTPVCDKGIVYHCGGWATPDYITLKLPETAGEELKPTIVYKAKPELPKVPVASFTFGRIASPLLNDGLLYHVTEGGALAVAEAATGKTVYTQMVEDFHARTTWVFYPGICCSPTLGGKHIYMMDDCGTTVVLEPGREFKKVAVNEFENMNAGGEQEQTLSTPIFEGSRMYFRSPGYLSCIGEK